LTRSSQSTPRTAPGEAMLVAVMTVGFLSGAARDGRPDGGVIGAG
jgi:hypothetical protein